MRGDKRPLPAPLSAELVQPEKVDAKLNASIHNRFDVEVIDSRTGEVRQRAQGENIILNQFWEQFTTKYFNYIQYGGGSGTPVASRNSLFSYIGGTAASLAGENLDYAKSVFSLKKKIQLSETDAVGSSITEVGIAYGTSSTTLITHAKLKNMNGEDISILKTSTDIINIYATFFIHFEKNNICELNYATTFRSIAGDNSFYFSELNAAANNNARSPQFSPQISFNLNASSIYDKINRKISVTASRLPVDKGNGQGIYGLNLRSYDGNNYTNVLWLDSTHWYPGDNIIAESIGTGDGSTVDFATKFPMISNAKLYVDGAPRSGVLICENTPFSNIGDYAYLSGTNVNGKFEQVGTLCFSPIEAPYAGYAGEIYYINRFHSKLSIAKIQWSTYAYSGITGVSISDDFINWTDIFKIALTESGGMTASVKPEYSKYRYLKIVYSSAGTSPSVSVKFNPDVDKQIHFNVAPAAGSVITADYHTALIAKDANHVFDFSCELQFGEYTPPVV